MCLDRILFLAIALALIQRSVQQEILLLHDYGDNYTTDSIIPHLNAAKSYFKHLTSSSLILNTEALLPNTTTEELCSKLVNISAIISVTTNDQHIENIIELATNTGIPTIQVYFNTTRQENNGTNVTLPSNYAGLVHPSLTFYSSIRSIIPRMDINGPVHVLQDDVFLRGFHPWWLFFQPFPVRVTYGTLALTPEKIRTQIVSRLTANEIFTNNTCQHNRTSLVLIGTTANLERWLNESSSLIVPGELQLIVVTTDITPFMCNSCSSTDMFWIRPYSDHSVQDVRDYNEYFGEKAALRKNAYTIKPWEELDASFFFHIWNSTLRIGKTEGANNFTCATELDQEISINDTPISIRQFAMNPVEREYGRYTEDSTGLHYQEVPVRVFRIWRNPNVRYAKLMGNWTPADGLHLQHGLLTKMPSDIKSIRVAAMLQHPFVERADNGSHQGYLIDLLHRIERNLSITCEIYLITYNRIGTTDYNNNWNGLMRELVTGSADLALGPITDMADRGTDVYLTAPIYDEGGIGAMMRKKSTVSSLLRIYQMFNWDVWLSLVLGVCLLAAAIHWSERLSPNSSLNNKDGAKKGREFTVFESLRFVLAVITGDEDEWPPSMCAHLIGLLWKLYIFMVVTLAFAATVTSFYAAYNLLQAIRSIDGLALQNTITYAPSKGTDAEAHLRNMRLCEKEFARMVSERLAKEWETTEQRRRLPIDLYPALDKFTGMMQSIEQAPLPQTSEEGIEKVISSTDATQFAWIGDTHQIAYSVLTNCQLQQIEEALVKKPTVLALQKGHPLSTNISNAIVMLRADFVLEDLRKTWWTDNPKREKCSNDSGQIPFAEVSGIFVLLLVGVLLALFVLRNVGLNKIVKKFFRDIFDFFRSREQSGGDDGEQDGAQQMQQMAPVADNVQPADVEAGPSNGQPAIPPRAPSNDVVLPTWSYRGRGSRSRSMNAAYRNPLAEEQSTVF